MHARKELETSHENHEDEFMTWS